VQLSASPMDACAEMVMGLDTINAWIFITLPF